MNLRNNFVKDKYNFKSNFFVLLVYCVEYLLHIVNTKGRYYYFYYFKRYENESKMSRGKEEVEVNFVGKEEYVQIAEKR